MNETKELLLGLNEGEALKKHRSCKSEIYIAPSIKTYPSHTLYLSIITLSIMVVVSSSNWFITWVGLELSLFGFLPLFSSNPITGEGVIKYFLIQAAGSALFLFSIIQSSHSLITLRITLKLGLFPFIQWIPLVIASLRWAGCLTLSTLQKISPLSILLTLSNTTRKIIIGAISLTLAGVLGYNQAVLRALLRYSSIRHSSWLLLCTILGTKLTMTYATAYFRITALLFASLTSSKRDIVNSLLNIEGRDQILLILVIAGIPPFPIFLLKINVIFLFLSYPLLLAILIGRTYLRTYFYLSFTLPLILKNTQIAWKILMLIRPGILVL